MKRLRKQRAQQGLDRTGQLRLEMIDVTVDYVNCYSVVGGNLEG